MPDRPLSLGVIAAAGLFSQAAAGEWTAAAEPGAAPDYRFTKCVAPSAVGLDAEAIEKAKRSRRAKTQAVRQYNAYIDASNAYFQCLNREAEADLAAYHAALSASYQAAQEAVMGDLDRLRDDLDLAPKQDPEPAGANADPALEEDLLGGALD